VCEPSLTPVEFHVTPYGEDVSAEPMSVPSTLKVTPATATLSLAFAESVTLVPPTVAPLLGAVRETVGGVVSGVAEVVKVWSEEVARFPDPSVERIR
jgi:hypothetical protein